MKGILCTALLCASAADIEVVLTTSAGTEGFNSDWAEITLATNSFVATPDTEAVAFSGGRIYLQNGGDLDDGDGDGFLSFTAGATPVAGLVLMAPGSIDSAGDAAGTNSVEAAPVAAGLSPDAGGEDIRGMAVDAAGNIYIALDDALGSALVRISSASDVAGTVTVEAFAASSAPGGVFDGTADMVISGTTLFALQIGAFGAAENQIVSFDLTALPTLTPTVVKSAADLTAAGLTTELLQGIDVTAADIFLAAYTLPAVPSAPAVIRFPRAGGPATVVATQDQFPGEGNDFITGGIEVDEATGNIFLLFDASGQVWRILGGTGAPTLFLSNDDIVNDADYIALAAGGAYEDANPFGLACDEAGGFVYLTLECANSDTDTIIRASQADFSSVSDWNLY